MAEENFERQNIVDVQEMDNVPENLHLPEEGQEVQEVKEEQEVHEVKEEQEVHEVKEEQQVHEVKGQEVQEVKEEQEVHEVQGEQEVHEVQEVQEIKEVQELHEAQADENDSGGIEEKKWPGWPGENVFRMLIPVQRVGGVIGRKGEYIKKVCEETKARIKILDGPPGITERAVLQIKQDFNLSWTTDRKKQRFRLRR